jgi:hypothetical protein
MEVKDALTGQIIVNRPQYKVISGKKKTSYTYIYSKHYLRFPAILVHGAANAIMNEELAIEMGYVWNERRGFFVPKSFFDNYDPKKDNFSSSNNSMKAKIHPLSRSEMIKYGMHSPTYLISERKDFTFGVEIETSSGNVSPYLLRDFNVAVVRDGSLYDNNGRKAYGGEYVTGVLRGDAGFIHLKRLLKVLSERTEINKTCSVHVHIGSFNFNKATIVMLWKLGLVLQNELYTMMPLSRRTARHCRPMRGNPSSITFSKKDNFEKKVNYYYDKIVRNVSLVGTPSKVINKKFNHPRGHYCGYDTSTPRYWWLNFVPALFSLKGEGNHTIEFRMHSATLNYTKIRNWILICMGIVSAAVDHQQFLIDNNRFTLSDIMKLTYKRKGRYLSDYIEERKKKFKSGMPEIVELSEYKVDRIKEPITVKSVAWD